MVQIRNVPEDLHRALKARAALEGVSQFRPPAQRDPPDRRAPELERAALASRLPGAGHTLGAADRRGSGGAGAAVIVVDASAILDLLLGLPPHRRSRSLFATGESLHAPHLLDLEVAQVLRRYSLAGELTATRGQQAIEDLAALPITRYPHDLFLLRIWALRHNHRLRRRLRGAGREPWRHAAHAGRAAARGAGSEGSTSSGLMTQTRACPALRSATLRTEAYRGARIGT